MTQKISTEKVLQHLNQLDLNDSEAYDLIHTLGDLEYVQAEAAVAKFLNSDDPGLRSIALNVLVIHWGLEKYTEICKNLLINDVDNDVRDMAASCLGSLYNATENRGVTELLIRSLRDEQEHWTVRQAAYDAILRILNFPLKDRPSMTKKMDFDRDINWRLVDDWSKK